MLGTELFLFGKCKLPYYRDGVAYLPTIQWLSRECFDVRIYVHRLDRLIELFETLYERIPDVFPLLSIK